MGFAHDTMTRKRDYDSIYQVGRNERIFDNGLLAAFAVLGLTFR